MTPTATQVLTAALDLPDEDRVEIIEALMASVGPAEGVPFDESWREVIRRRSAELDSGAIASIPWEEVKRRAREALGG